MLLIIAFWLNGWGAAASTATPAYHTVTVTTLNYHTVTVQDASA